MTSAGDVGFPTGFLDLPAESGALFVGFPPRASEGPPGLWLLSISVAGTSYLCDLAVHEEGVLSRESMEERHPDRNAGDDAPGSVPMAKGMSRTLSIPYSCSRDTDVAIHASRPHIQTERSCAKSGTETVTGQIQLHAWQDFKGPFGTANSLATPLVAGRIWAPLPCGPMSEFYTRTR